MGYTDSHWHGCGVLIGILQVPLNFLDKDVYRYTASDANTGHLTTVGTTACADDTVELAEQSPMQAAKWLWICPTV